MLHKPITNYLNSVIGKKIDEKRYLNIINEQNDEGNDSDSLWNKILKTSLVDNFITNNQIIKYREIYDRICLNGLKKENESLAMQIDELASLENIEKVVKPTDVHVPVQKRTVSDYQYEILESQYRDGSHHLDEDDIAELYRMIETSKPLEQECVVYRGIIPREGSLHNNAFIESIKEGSEITRSGWTSTATRYD